MVICDTSVFYDISKGQIAKAWFQNEQVAATLMSLVELSKSYKLVSRMKDVRECAKAIKNHSQTIIYEDAYDFAIKRLVPAYEVNPEGWKPVKESYKLLLTHELINTGNNLTVATGIIDAYEKPFQDSIGQINKLLDQRPKIKQAFKDAVRIADLTPQTKAEIKGMLEHQNLLNNPAQPIIIDENADEWKDLEFFINVWTDFHKEFIRDTNKRMKDNDWIDLWIMAYVGRNDLYWTMETQWINLIKKNPVTSNYLHPLSGKRRII